MSASSPLAEESRPYAVVLGPGSDPTEFLHRLRDEPGLVCLSGDWFGADSVITHSPLRSDVAVADLPEPWLTPRGADAAADQPVRIGGGWVGVLGYEQSSSTGALYDWVLRRDPSAGWVFESLGLPEAAAGTATALVRLRSLLSAPEDSVEEDSVESGTPAASSPEFRTSAGFRASHQAHLAIIERAQQLIRAGDFYQVNLCTRLLADTDLSPTDAFIRCLATLQPVHGALINTDGSPAPQGRRGPPGAGTRGGFRGLVSMSPELFLSVHGDRVVTRPIKGTAPRADDETDAPALRSSVKESAENVMIVDLMRNDLSRVCRPGTVVVSGLLDLEAHPGVWHLVSTVEGRLRPDVRLDEVLAETFPPGSVTGAPKSSAVRAIAELEHSGREAYTGSLGMISPFAGAAFNVLIRTFEFSRTANGNRVELGVGGGITSDSVPELEWAECLHKARPLVSAIGGTLPDAAADRGAAPTQAQWSGGIFETCLVQDGRVRRLRRHLARLDRSCRELYGVGLPDNLADRVRAAARTAVAESAAARRSLKIIATPTSSGIAVELITRPLGDRLQQSPLSVAHRPTGCWRHKWVVRTRLDRAEDAVAPALPLFLDEEGTVLEGSRGNLFLLAGSEVHTPPLRDGLLPGVTREALIELVPTLGFDVSLAGFTVRDLWQADAVWWTSSLSGVVAVPSVDGRPLRQRPEVLAGFQRALDA